MASPRLVVYIREPTAHFEASGPLAVSGTHIMKKRPALLRQTALSGSRTIKFFVKL
jgi:hypothetical protein